MAQALFDAIAAGMDSQTAMAVQSLLDSQDPQNTEAVQQQVSTELADDDDVLQCGRCKKQFTSLGKFVVHKQTRCVPAAVAVQQAQAPSNSQSLSPSPNTAFTPAVCSVGQILRGSSVNTFSNVSASPLSGTMVLSEDLIYDIQSIQTSSLPGGSSLASSPFLTPVAAPQQSASSRVATVSNTAALTVIAGSTGTFTSPTATFTTVPSNQLQFTAQPQLATAQGHIVGPITLPIHVAPSSKQEAKVNNSVTIVLEEEPPGVVVAKPRKNAKADESEDATPSGKRKHACQYCEKTFGKNFDLAQHVRSHTGEKPFQCIVCGRAFAQKSNVKKHMQTHKVWPSGTSRTLPTQPIPVPVSGNSTDNVANLHIHVQEEGSDRPPDSQYGTATVESGVDGSKMNVVIDNSYLCQYCPEKFRSYFQLKTHMTSHKSEQVYKCVLKTCQLTFNDLDSFLEHTKTHEQSLTYRCHICNKNFQSLYELGVHQYSHSLYPNQGPKPGPRHFRCSKCNNKYATPEALEHHIQTTTHTFNCPHCSKVFTCERYLRRHLPTHGTVGEFGCPICQKHFKTEHYLKVHMLIHSGEKPYKCHECSAEFNRKDKLKRHQLIHEPVKRYKCPFKSYTGCTREFNRPDKLKAHIITHSGLKPFKCNACGRSFSRRSHLVEHERIHNDNYNFRCDTCKRGFFRQKLLDEHRCRGAPAGAPAPQPEMFRRKSKRKAGRPRKRMITVTEEIAKERSVRRMIGRRLRPGPRMARNMPTEPEPEPEEPAPQTEQEEVVVELPVPEVPSSNQEQAMIIENSPLHPEPDPNDPNTHISEVSAVHAMSIPMTPQEHYVTMSMDGTTTALQVTVGEGGQLLTDGVAAQVITIQPADFAQQFAGQVGGIIEGHQVGGVLEGQQVEAMQVSHDLSGLHNARLIATGPNRATLVVNANGELLEPILTVPGQQTYVTAEQLESLQAEGAVYHTETLMPTTEVHGALPPKLEHSQSL